MQHPARPYGARLLEFQRLNLSERRYHAAGAAPAVPLPISPPPPAARRRLHAGWIVLALAALALWSWLTYEQALALAQLSEVAR